MLATIKHLRTVQHSAAFCTATSAKTYDVVGVIGLGNMGAHMARNLLSKGKQVVAYDGQCVRILNLDARRRIQN